MKACVVGLALIIAVAAQGQITLVPLNTFGGGDGWLAPGEGGYAYLGTANNERGMAYGNGHVYLVSRASVGGNALNIRMLNPVTGADLGGLGIGSGVISGGTFAINTIGVGGDGAIYLNNLTTSSTTSPFKVYRWANEAATPTVAYSGNGGLAGSRVGDSLAVIGSGASTLLAAGYGSSPVVTGNNGYAILDPTAGAATAIGFTGTPPNAGDFRLSVTFVDPTRVIGAQGSSIYRYTSFAGANGTLIASPTIPDPAGATADRLLSYNMLGGVALLAVGSIGDSHVSLYDVTDPANPVWLASGNNTSGTLAANANGTGQIAWGDVTDNGDGTFSETLYTMSSNQGIQAFIVTVPEPAVGGLILFGLGALAFWRRARG